MKVDHSIAPQGSPQAPSATDFRQFAALRRGAEANDPKVLREAAKQFESLFTKMMLESMRKASFGDPMFGSDQGDMYQGMMDDQMAVQLSQGKGLGLADMLIRQLSHGAVAGSNQTEAPAGNVVDDTRRQRFIEQVMPHAQAAARELGVDPRALVAQAALETGWGTSLPGHQDSSHNLFGIKAGESWHGASVTSGTTEYDAGALDTGTDVRAFATALQKGGYATDPEYANKLIAVAERLGLAAPVTAFKSDVAAPIAMTTSRTNDA